MSTFQVFAGGTQVSKVTDVTYGQSTGSIIPTATVVCANTSTNRSLFSSGADVVIKREDQANPGTYDTEFTGVVQGNPSIEQKSNLLLEVNAETRMSDLQYEKVNRPFIETDTGNIVKQAANNVIEPYTRPEFIHKGADFGNWSGDAPIFELADVHSKGLNEYGTNLIFAGWREDESGEYTLTYTGVPAAAAPGRQLLKFETRILVNNRGNVFSGSVELVDSDGVVYSWTLDIPAFSGFRTYSFGPEDATSVTTGGGSRELRYNITIGGSLPEDRALVIDMARTTPFETNNRSSSLSTGGIETTGRVITRRVDGSVLEVAQTLATEDGAVLHTDKNNVIHYETAGDTHVPAALNITDDGSTTVVNVDVDRDFDVRNRVTVQGKGDLQGTFEDTGSIEFYNKAVAKEEQIYDTSIRTKAQLKARAVGFLNKHAWDDTIATFTIADAEYRDVQIGDAIDVTWSVEDIGGTFTVSTLTTTAEGYVQVGITGNTTA